MTAYSLTELTNLIICEQSKEAKSKGYISITSFEKIRMGHPLTLYAPNIFVQIGLALLTTFIILSALGIMLLLFDLTSGIVGLCIFTGLATYATLEVMVSSRKHYNSGVDNMLMIFVPTLILTGIAMETNNAERMISFLCFIICLWLSIRFVDRLMALVATLSLIAFTFNVYDNLGEFTISSFPFLLISISTIVYFSAKRLSVKNNLLVYKPCLQIAEAVGLLSMYAFGNYYFIDEMTNDTYLLQQDSPLRMTWFFWTWTFLFPIISLGAGIVKRDMLLLRTGIILVAIAILTFRYYHAVLPAETALIVAGLITISFSYWLMRYLKQPKHGFVSEENKKADPDHEDLEGLIIGEVYGEEQVVAEEARFGGGSFGGAGAGSNY